MRMSFYDGTLNREKAKEMIKQSDLPITYTYGLSYRRPTTYHKPITKEIAFNKVDKESLLDVDFGENEIHLNGYSSNDMF